MSSRINRTPKKRAYTRIANAVLTDTRLSWAAQGVLTYLLSKTDNWQVRTADLVHQRSEGRRYILSCLKELEQYGYLERRCIQGAGGKFEWISTIHETPRVPPE